MGFNSGFKWLIAKSEVQARMIIAICSNVMSSILVKESLKLRYNLFPSLQGKKETAGSFSSSVKF